MPVNWPVWVLFHLFVFAMLALDLGVFQSRAHALGLRESVARIVIWVALAAAFAALIYFHGHTLTGDTSRPNRVLSLEFITGYVLEQTLSVDNLFVILLLFRYFRVPAQFQPRVLFWGILGALLTRAVFILAGFKLLNRFHWVFYLFGAFLVYAGLKLFARNKQPVNPEANPLVRSFRAHVRMVPGYDNGRFFVRQNGIVYATLLTLVLLVVETTDVVFAADSIPAILSISRDPFIVYTSNVFAVLGLRSLFFALAGMMQAFPLLNYGVAAILVFIGGKMLVAHWLEIPTAITLATIAGVLVLSVALSPVLPKTKEDAR